MLMLGNVHKWRPTIFGVILDPLATYPKIGRDLAPSFEDFSQSEKLSEIKPPLIARCDPAIGYVL